MSVEVSPAETGTGDTVQQTTTRTSTKQQSPSAASETAALLTPPPSPQTRRSHNASLTPQRPTCLENKKLPTSDSSRESVTLREPVLKSTALEQKKDQEEPTQATQDVDPSNLDNLARVRTPAGASRAQVGSVCPRPSNKRVRSALELIEQVRDTKYRLHNGEFYSERKLLPNEFKQLLSLITASQDIELKTYYYDKLRYDIHVTKSEIKWHGVADETSGSITLPP